MRKKIEKILAALSLLAMTGCSSSEGTVNTVNSADLEKYKSYYEAILSRTEFEGEGSNFTMNLEMTKVSDGGYCYYIVVDEPKTAMYDCAVMAVENDTPYEENKKMMPSLGIFDDSTSLVPGQVNKSDGYAKGLVISGETDEGKVDLKIVVEWSNEKKDKTSSEYLSFHLTPSGAVHEESDS
jgi:hypothetical protein